MLQLQLLKFFKKTPCSQRKGKESQSGKLKLAFILCSIVAVIFGTMIGWNFDHQPTLIKTPLKQAFNSPSVRGYVSKTAKMLLPLSVSLEATQIEMVADREGKTTTRTRLLAKVDQNSFHSPRGFSYRWRLPSVKELRPGQRVEVYQGVLTGTVTATSRQPNSLNLAELELWVDGLDYTPILDGGRPQLIHFDMSYYNESGSEVHGATAVFSTHPMNSNLEQEPHPLSLELQAQSAAQE